MRSEAFRFVAPARSPALPSASRSSSRWQHPVRTFSTTSATFPSHGSDGGGGGVSSSGAVTGEHVPRSPSQALHSALLSLSRQEHLRRIASDARHSVWVQPRPQANVTSPRHSMDGQGQATTTTTAASPPSAATNQDRGRGADSYRKEKTGEQEPPLVGERGDSDTLLNRLLVKHREAARGSTSPRVHSDTPHRAAGGRTMEEVAMGNQRRQRDGAQKNSTQKSTDDGDALEGDTTAVWHTAVEMFARAVRDNAVTPTTQHFNLLLGLVMQDQQWDQVDRVEDFYARFLYSTQELRLEKEKELAVATALDERSYEEEEGEEHQFHSTTDIEATAPSPTAQPDAERGRRLHKEVAELALVEASLRPNQQTFDLLMQASLQRRAWARVLEYFDNCREEGIAVRDGQLQYVLRACLLGGARTTEPSEARDHEVGGREPTAGAVHPAMGRMLQEASSNGGPHSTATTAAMRRHASDMLLHNPLRPHGTFQGRTRLLTNQRGPGLAAAARPRSPHRENTPKERSPRKLWEVALSIFNDFRHAVTTAQTVWLMVRLLQDAGQFGPLQRVYEDCVRLVPHELPSGLGAAEDEAAMEIHLAVAAAARERGDWPLNLRLWRAAAHSWQLHDALPSLLSDISAWDGSRGRQPVAAASGPGQQLAVQVASDQLTTSGVQDEDTARRRMLLHAQQLLVEALYTLRRVRRYRDIANMYPWRDGATDSAAAAAMDFLPLWTPRALAFVAQAAMADRNLPQLLELVYLTPNSSGARGVLRGIATHAMGLTTAGSSVEGSVPPTLVPPVDVFDAALQTAQALSIAARCGQAPLDGTRANSPEELLAVSQGVYKQFLVVATREARALDRFQKSERDTTAILTTAHLPALRARMEVSAGGRRRDDLEDNHHAKQALSHLARIRRPDAVLLTLTMDTIKASVATTNAHRPDGPRHADSSALATDVIAVFHGCVAEARAMLSSRSSSSTADGNNKKDEDVKLAMGLTAVTGPCVESACEALCSLGHPFTALTLLEMAGQYLWLPPSRVIELQVRAHHTALRIAERNLQKTEEEIASAAAVVPTAESTLVSVTAKTGRSDHGSSGAMGLGTGEAVGALVALAAASEQAERANSLSPPQATPLSCCGLVRQAVDVMRQLQSGTHKPPTEAVVALLHELQAAAGGGTNNATIGPSSLSPSSSPPPTAERVEILLAIPIIVNAVLQQVSVTTTSRWALWPQCVEMVSLLSPPHAAVLSGPVAPRADMTTVKVLADLVRFSDKAEAPLVEAIALNWLASNVPSGDGAATQLPTDACRLDRISEGGHKEDPSHLLVASQCLLLDCVRWACRRRHKPLVRKLLDHPRVAALLFSDSIHAAKTDTVVHTAANTRTLPDVSTVKELREEVVSTLIAVLQCLSSGDHKDILIDWPHITISFDSIHKCCVGEISGVGIRRCPTATSPVLLESLSAVLAKLQLSLVYLVKGVAFDVHRRHCGDNGTAVPLPTTEYIVKVEEICEEFIDLAETRFVNEMVLPVLCASPDSSDDRSTQARHATLMLAAVRNSIGAAWEVLFSHFTWFTVFKQANSSTAGCERADLGHKALSSFSDRARRLLMVEISLWGDGDPCASNNTGKGAKVAAPDRARKRHLEMWCVIHGVVLGQQIPSRDRVCSGPPTLAMAFLCAEVTTMESLQGCRAVMTATDSQPVHHNTPPVSSFFVPKRRNGLYQVGAAHSRSSSTSRGITIVEHLLLTIDRITESSLASSISTDISHGIQTEARHRGSPLPPLRGSRTPATAMFTDPHHHLDHRVHTVAPLQVLHESALNLLRMALCEGNDELVQTNPSLVRRVLSWPIRSASDALYLSTLQALEGIDMRTLRSPDAAADVFRQISRQSSRWHGSDLDGSESRNAELYLRFLTTSKVFRGVGVMQEDVAAEALLCLAHAPLVQSHAARAQQAASLVLMFPSLVPRVVLPRFLDGQLAAHQRAHLDAWFHAAIAGAASSTSSATLLRCAVLWFLGTRGAVPSSEDAEEVDAHCHARRTAPVELDAGVHHDVAQFARVGDERWVVLVSLGPQALLQCHARSAKGRGRSRGYTSSQRAIVQLLRDRRLLPLQSPGIATSNAAPSQDAQSGAPLQSEAAARDADVLQRSLTRSSALQLLALCFPDACRVHERAARRVPCSSLTPVFRAADLATVLSAAGGRISAEERAAVEQANEARRVEREVLQSLEHSAAEQRLRSSNNSRSNSSTARRRRDPLQMCSHALAEALATRLSGRGENTAALITLVVQEEMQRLAADRSNGSVGWDVGSVADWITTCHRRGRNAAHHSTAATAESLSALQRAVVHLGAEAAEEAGDAATAMEILLGVLAANGVDSVPILLTGGYERVCVSHTVSVDLDGSASLSRQQVEAWHRGVGRLLCLSLRLVKVAEDGETPPATTTGRPSPEEELRICALAFALRRVATDAAVLELACGPAMTITPAAKETNAQLLALHRHVASGVEAFTTSSVVDGNDARWAAVRAWLHAGILLGRWKDLAHLASRGGGQYFSFSSIAIASTIAAMDRPRPLTPLSDVITTPRAGSVYASLDAALHSPAIDDISCRFSQIAGRKPSFTERLILAAPLSVVIESTIGGGSGLSEQEVADLLVPSLLSNRDQLQAVMLASGVKGPAATTTTTAKASPPCQRTKQLSQSPHAPLTVAEALAVLEGGSPAAYAVFVKGESLRTRSRSRRSGRIHASAGGKDAAEEEEEAGAHIKAAWTMVMGSLRDPNREQPDPHALKRLFFRLRCIPHTKHFIPTAFSAAVISGACETFTEALRAIEFSLSTLQRSGGRATPVQQYMAYLLVQRAQRCLRSPQQDGGNTVPFVQGLDSFYYPPRASTPGAGDEGASTGLAALSRACYSLLAAHGGEASLAPQFILVELLRAATSDADLALHLYGVFWRQAYNRLEGVKVFLSLLRTATVSGREDVALLAMRDFLFLLRHTASPATAATDAEGLLPAADSLPSSVHCPVFVPHSFSHGNNQIVWKSFAAACRAGSVSEDAAKRVVATYKCHSPFGVSDVEELLVTVAVAQASSKRTRS